MSALVQQLPRDRVIWALGLLTAASGVADAVSILALGRVFVANMTGNVVFIGFAAAGDQDLSVEASLAALAAFIAGAAAGGWLGGRLEGDRRRWLVAAFSLELAWVAVAIAIALTVGHGGDLRYAVIVPLGLALGLQNATVRRLAVPGMVTTVLTGTLTHLAADAAALRAPGPRWRRQAASVALMFAGAVAGGVLVLDVSMTTALCLLLLLIALAAACVWDGGRGERT